MKVLDSIEDFLKDEKYVEYVRIDGKVQNENKDLAVKTFQEDENCLVALLGITAAGIGITLTAASTVLFAELFFTPALMIQAEDRTHRIGQKNSVNIHYLYGPNTIDEIMFPRLRDKYFVVSTTLDDEKQDLNLEKIDVGIVGDFTNEEGILTQIKTEKEEYEDFIHEVEVNEGMIMEGDFEELANIDEDVLGQKNFHVGNYKRTRNYFDDEDEDDNVEGTEDTTISLEEGNIFNNIPRRTAKLEKKTVPTEFIFSLDDEKYSFKSKENILKLDKKRKQY